MLQVGQRFDRPVLQKIVGRRKEPSANRADATCHAFRGRIDRGRQGYVHVGGDEALDAVVEDDAQRDAGMRTHEFEQHRRDEHSAEAGWHADAHMAAQCLAEPVDRCAGGAQLFEHAPAAFVKGAPRLRQIDAACQAAQQLCTRFTLEHLEPVADVGTRHAKVERCGAQAAGIDARKGE